jgi:hypothetical protein
MFVVRESRQGWEVRRVVVAKDKGTVWSLVMISIHIALNVVLNIDKRTEVENRAIEAIDAASDEADIGTTLVVGHTVGVNNTAQADQGIYLPEICFDQRSCTLCNA